MKKLILVFSLLTMILAGGCSRKPSKASELYNGCIFVVKNGEITSYGVFVEVKERISDFSIQNLRTYDEDFVDDIISYQADPMRIYYRNSTVFNACHKDGYGEHSYFMTTTQPLYKIPDQAYKKLISKLKSASIEVQVKDTKTNGQYTYSTVLPVVETEENSSS